MTGCRPPGYELRARPTAPQVCLHFIQWLLVWGSPDAASRRGIRSPEALLARAGTLLNHDLYDLSLNSQSGAYSGSVLDCQHKGYKGFEVGRGFRCSSVLALTPRLKKRRPRRWVLKPPSARLFLGF